MQKPLSRPQKETSSFSGSFKKFFFLFGNGRTSMSISIINGLIDDQMRCCDFAGLHIRVSDGRKAHCKYAGKTKIKEIQKWIERWVVGHQNFQLRSRDGILLHDYDRLGDDPVVAHSKEIYVELLLVPVQKLDVSTGTLSIGSLSPVCGYKHPKINRGLACTARVEVECKTCMSLLCQSCDEHAHRLFSKKTHTRTRLLGLPMKLFNGTVAKNSEEKKMQDNIDFFS